MNFQNFPSTDVIISVLNTHFSKKKTFKKILHKKEKFVSVVELVLLHEKDSDIAFTGIVEYETVNAIQTRNYTFCFYNVKHDPDLIRQDQNHVKIIRELDLYPIGKIHFITKSKLKIPYLVVEDYPENFPLRKIRKPLDLTNERWVNQKLHLYLAQKKGVLLKRNEKFQKVIDTKTLSYGLNNIVFKFTVIFRSKAKPANKRSYVLRVAPNNNNRVKIINEAKRLQQVTKNVIPNPKLYLFEDNLTHLGYRFLILELLHGNSIVENLANFTEFQAKEFLSSLAKILGTLHSYRAPSYDSYYIIEKTTKKYQFSTYIMMEIKRALKNFKEMELDKELNIESEYLYKWCSGHKPLLDIEEFSLIHGDIRPSNILAHDYKITGLIDWEMSCYSDPAHDIGWSLFFFKLYDNLKDHRGFFFKEYWKTGNKFDIEARVYFYEVLAALKLYIYSRYIEKNDPKKYISNYDFFERVKKAMPDYIERITHRD